MDALAEAVAKGETIRTEIIGDKAMGRDLVTTAESKSIEATAQPESLVPVKKPALKGKDKKGAAPSDYTDK